MIEPHADSPTSPAEGAGGPVAPWSPLHTLAEAGGEEVAQARLSFLGGERPTPGAVRSTILASWQRSRLWEVRPDALEVEDGRTDVAVGVDHGPPVLPPGHGVGEPPDQLPRHGDDVRRRPPQRRKQPLSVGHSATSWHAAGWVSFPSPSPPPAGMSPLMSPHHTG